YGAGSSRELYLGEHRNRYGHEHGSANIPIFEARGKTWLGSPFPIGSVRAVGCRNSHHLFARRFFRTRCGLKHAIPKETGESPSAVTAYHRGSSCDVNSPRKMVYQDGNHSNL